MTPLCLPKFASEKIAPISGMARISGIGQGAERGHPGHLPHGRGGEPDTFIILLRENQRVARLYSDGYNAMDRYRQTPTLHVF